MSTLADVFVALPPERADTLSPLSDIYAWTARQPFAVDAEHVMIYGVPVQFLPAYNDLVEEAIATARAHDYDGVRVQVVGPEHLVALALQAGGGRRRERGWQLLESGEVDRDRLRAVLAKHSISAEVPNDE